MRLLAIDFGTSNTVAALLIDGQAPRTVNFDTSPMLPSAVYYSVDGRLTVGREAQRLARLDPTRFEPNPKRRVDDGEMLLGDRVLPVVDALAAVLCAVAIEVRRQLGGALPDEVRLTHPAQWGAIRQNVLVSAARAAGLGANLVLIPEPVAAAAQFTRLPGRALPVGGTVAVYDLGGGTFDIAIVGRTERPGPGSGSTDAGQFHVLAEAGLPDLGGLDFDQAILDHVGRVASGADPGRWQQLLRPADATARRAGRALADDVRAAKETLSRYPQTEISLPEPFVDAHVTRTEFEGLIRPNLSRSIELLSDVIQRAGIRPDRLSGIFLVGGSSRIPLVAALIQDRLHVTPVALDQPETAVALGALLVPVRMEGNRTAALAGDQRGSVPGSRPFGASGALGSYPTGSEPGSTASPAGGMPSVPRPSATGRRREVAIVGAVALIVVVAVVLFVGKPFGSSPVASPTGVPTTNAATTRPGTPDPTTASGGTPTRSGPSPRNSSATRSAGATGGLGPGKAFSAAEVGFLGVSVNKLTNCGVYTSAFNGAVTARYQVARAIRCQVPGVDLVGSLAGERLLVYLLTTKNGSTTDTFLNQLVKDRKKVGSDLSKYDSDQRFTVGSVTGRVMTAYDLPALSSDPDHAASVLGWEYAGQPYVGLVVSLSGSLQDDLTNYWSQNYKPRG